MYVIVQHLVSNPAKFWNRAEQETLVLPSHLKLHHCFPSDDGTRAVCLWEADSVGSVEQFFVNNGLDQSSSNTFFGVENKEGIALPSLMQRV
jgi:hypothetical protein